MPERLYCATATASTEAPQNYAIVAFARWVQQIQNCGHEQLYGEARIDAGSRRVSEAMPSRVPSVQPRAWGWDGAGLTGQNKRDTISMCSL